MRKFLASRRAFYIIAGVFALQSLFIALTARYPMAFDEFFHYGVTQLHTETWLPFLSNVPDSASIYGAITRDPSFLYHYLLSFPLRILNALTSSVTWHILILRILNIGVAVGSLFVYRRLLMQIGTSALTTNIVLLFLILIPVFPLMAGQVTYDNLFFLLVPAVMLLAVRFVRDWYGSAKVNAATLNALLLTGLFTCFVKYAFIPALAAIVGYIAVLAARKPRRFATAYKSWWQESSRRSRALTISAAVIGLWLYAGSYGLNMVRYQTPIPSCEAVLSVDDCSNYGPWARDHMAKEAGGYATLEQLPWYVDRWTRQMLSETFFMVGARFMDNGTVDYYSRNPLTLIFVAAWGLLISGLAILLWRIRQIMANPVFRLIVIVLAVYSIALFGRNLQFFLETGGAVAIHGRYLLPFIPPLIAVIVLAARQAAWPQFVTRRVVAVLGAVVFLCFLQGGVVSYILLSDKTWMWPQSSAAQNVTDTAKRVLSPVVFRR